MGLSFIPENINIDFVGKRKISYVISVVLILVGIIALIIKGGPSYGIDFAGGTVVQVQFAEAIDDAQVKDALAGAELEGAVIQSFGNDSTSYLIRISSNENTDTASIKAVVESSLNKNIPDKKYEIVRTEMVGPKVGADLRAKAVEALYFATLFMAVYVSGRFEQRWTIALLMAGVLAGGMYLFSLIGISKMLAVLLALCITIALAWYLKLAFALGAIVSIVHDLLVTVGVFVLLDKEFDLTIIAALLTIVGYSLNDTIIVFDRIRENLHLNRHKTLMETINLSVNQTLSRTVLTSGTTLFVVLALLIFGGSVIHDFALVTLIGVLVGTLSSIFIASPILLYFEDTIKNQLASREKEKELAKLKKHGAPQV